MIKSKNFSNSDEVELDYSSENSQLKQLLRALMAKKGSGEGTQIERGGTNFTPPPSEILQAGSVLGPEALLALMRPEFSSTLGADSLAATGEDSPGVRAAISSAYEGVGREGKLRRRSAELDLASKMQALRKSAISQAGGGKGESLGSAYQGQNPRDRDAAMRAKEISRQLLEEQLASLKGQREAFENKAQDQDRSRDSIIPQLLRLIRGVSSRNYF